jgi:hypothetical protein
MGDVMSISTTTAHHETIGRDTSITSPINVPLVVRDYDDTTFTLPRRHIIIMSTTPRAHLWLSWRGVSHTSTTT